MACEQKWRQIEANFRRETHPDREAPLPPQARTTELLGGSANGRQGTGRQRG